MSTMKCLVNIMLVLLIQRTCASFTCQNGWALHGDKCYAFIRISDTWINAYSYCQALSGKLVRISTAGENNFIQKTAKYKNSGNVWIDGQDMVVTNEWHFTDGDTEEKLTYFNWCHGQPDSNGTQPCIRLLASDDYCWDDTYCDGKPKGFVCETMASYGDILGK